MSAHTRHEHWQEPVDDRGPLLRLCDLHVAIPQRKGVVTPLRGVDLTLEAGRTLGIVGESGSGKTMTSLAIMGRSEEHTSELQSRFDLVCRLLLDKNNQRLNTHN